ncbi:MAG TPA: hypothetical protein VLV81_07380 [Acidimicrobiia bacterium]|nr:hypothetical protein [Acidimicrobiia bacterium]
MPDETEPTPAAPPPAAATPPAEARPSEPTEETRTARTGVHIPKWAAVAVAVLALLGGGFAIGRATGSDHHGGLVPIDARGGDRQSPAGFGPGAGRNLPGRGGDPTGNDGSNSNDGSNGNNSGSNGATTPATTPGTGA